MTTDCIFKILLSAHPGVDQVLRPSNNVDHESGMCFVSQQEFFLKLWAGFCSMPNARKPKPTILVLLPGPDGTDVFFRPLLAGLPEWITPMVVQFPTAGANEYPDLLANVRETLSKIPHFYVLGSSFAGPLALMLAAAEPNRVRGVILSTTFVRPPRPIYAQLRWAAVTPAIWMVRAFRRIPVWLSRGPTDRLRQDKTETWNRVSSRMVAARIRALLKVDTRDLLRDCPQPVLCLAGSDDGIVPRHNVEEIMSVRPSVRVRMIEDPHFAMYTNPRAAAEAIAEFMNNGKRSR
jgi:pimeloyl-ACP methyl ester carboxylesterase